MKINRKSLCRKERKSLEKTNKTVSEQVEEEAC